MILKTFNNHYKPKGTHYWEKDKYRVEDPWLDAGLCNCCGASCTPGTYARGNVVGKNPEGTQWGITVDLDGEAFRPPTETEIASTVDTPIGPLYVLTKVAFTDEEWDSTKEDDWSEDDY